MNRRNFLATFAAACTLDPERALFVPGNKLISIPKPRAARHITFSVDCGTVSFSTYSVYIVTLDGGRDLVGHIPPDKGRDWIEGRYAFPVPASLFDNTRPLNVTS